MAAINQATNWLLTGEALSIESGQLVKCGPIEKLQRFCLPNRQCDQIEKLTEFVANHLASCHQPEERQAYIELADALITRYYGDRSTKKVIQAFERTVASQHPVPLYQHPENKTSLQKWIKCGMPAEIHFRHPQFCAFMESSGLLSQMKITRDAVFEIDGEAAILVNGQTMKWSELSQEFEVQESKLYKENFITHKKSRITYTYLDNGLGLQAHHPYLTGLTPISKLDEKDFQAVTRKAQEFIRPGEESLTQEERAELNAQRPHIIQLVSSYTKRNDSNLNELVINPEHPYLRLIAGRNSDTLPVFKGDVFEVGYRAKEKIVIPFETTQGMFRSPDACEYKSCGERIITNIPVSIKEAQNFYDYTMHYHRDGIHLGNPIAFHLLRQNCSTYVRTALQVAGVTVPTEMTLPSLIHEVAPDWIRKINSGCNKLKQSFQALTKKISEIFLPKSIKDCLHRIANKISEIFQSALAAMTALGLVPINAALGGALGGGGRAFVSPGTPEERVDAPLKNWKNWLKLSNYTVNLPGVLQRWQRQQASTVIYYRPVKLSIVP